MACAQCHLKGKRHYRRSAPGLRNVPALRLGKLAAKGSFWPVFTTVRGGRRDLGWKMGGPTLARMPGEWYSPGLLTARFFSGGLASNETRLASLAYLRTSERSMKTYMAKPTDVEQKWLLVDATDKIVGRLASDIAVRLMGKHRPTYTPHVDTGDFVVVLNAEKVTFTGKKWEQKKYTWYTGYTRQRSITAGDRLQKHPEDILREAVRRMLPKNKLATKMLSKLKVYTGTDHPHQAQNPVAVDLGVKKK